MAFGKPPIQTANVGGWRQRATARQEDKKQTQAKTAYAGSRFSDQLRIDGTAITIRLIPGQYAVKRAVEIEKNKWGVQTEQLEFFEAVEHRDAVSARTCICSAGPLWFNKTHAQPCVGCAGYWATEKGANGRREGRFSRREIFIFSALVYGEFAKVPQTDKDGFLRVSAKTGNPYTMWVPARPNLVDVQELKQGHMHHLTVGHKHLNQLYEYDKEIGQTCCNCREPIVRRALLCAKCGTDIIDCSHTNFTEDQIEQALTTSTACPHCGHNALLQEYVECGCQQPRRASIFDVDITLKKIGAGTQSQLMVLSWSDPHPIDPVYKAKPLNLPVMFQPDTVEAQERAYSVSLSDFQK